MITFWRFKILEKYPKRIICDDGNIYNDRGKLLSLKPSRKGGYLRCRMYHLKRETYTWVHRMVAYAFLGDCTKKEVHHINRNVKDNRSVNLEILTIEQHRQEHIDTQVPF